MRLISCNIENFGKLSGVNIDFSADGITSFYESNGWGKSTLAAFIKVMLFGFDNENKRSAQEKERLKYKPWQGGVYGGELRIETEKGEFVVSRTFGTKEKDDVFELTDAKTMLSSKDYSEKIGEELFGLDSESFKKSIMICQNQCPTTTTDSINAHLGNITDSEADINDYEKLNKRITDLLNSMSPRRATGSINILKNRAEELKQEIKNGSSLENLMEECSKLLKAQRKNVAELTAQLETQYNKRKEYSRYKDLELKKKEYESLVEEEKRLGKLLKQKEAVFHGYVPSGEELDEYIVKSNRLMDAKKTMEAYGLNPDEQIELEQLKRLDDEGEFSDERLEALVKPKQDTSGQNDNSGETGDLETADSDNIPGRSLSILGVTNIVIGIVIAAIGIAVVIGGVVSGLNNQLIGISILSAGMADIIVGIIINAIYKKKLQQRIAIKQERMVEAEKLKTEMIKAELEAKWAKRALLENKKSAYSSLKTKHDKYIEAQAEYTNLNQSIEEFFDKMYIRMDADPRVQLVNLSNEHKEYMRILRDYGEKKNGLEIFIKENDVEKLNNLLPVKEEYSLSELEADISQLEAKLKQAEKNAGEYENQLFSLQERKDELASKECCYREMVSKLENDERNYRLLNGVKDNMEKAKDALISRYTEPVKTSFEKYKNILLGLSDKETNDGYYIDARMNLTVKQMGMRREGWTQSAGFQDLMGICLRMAFVDVMYEKEKPFVIFDDPFVNLDDEKLENGIQLLKEISKEHQIIYFTCHKSRTV